MRERFAFVIMKDSTWKRHSNPKSVWTRFLSFPVLVAIIWYRDALGVLFLPALFAVLFWLWINPGAFSPPKHDRAWSTRAVLGEQIWAGPDGKRLPLEIRKRAIHAIILGLVSVLVLILGLVMSIGALVASGTAAAVAFKLWFLDVMVDVHRHEQRRISAAAEVP